MGVTVKEMPIAVGRGMDRATGLVAVNPAAPVDSGNIYARDAKMALRPGLAGTGYPPLSWGTDLLAVAALAATLEELFVVYDRDTREVRVYRLDTIHNVLQTLASPANGLWGTLLGTDFPVVAWGEANGLMFFAHDEADLASRLPTIYYTPNADLAFPGTLSTLTADLDNDGVAETVYFRGVVPYLVYMGGWGFGTATDPDRGDVFRLSMPGDPTNFQPPNYVLCGVRKDPIIGAVPTTGSLSVVSPLVTVLALLKSDSAFRLSGASFDDFAVDLLDARYGTVSSRASVNIGGQAYTWASDGPRKVSPGGTLPVGQPLELISPLPDDFPALGPSRLCFAAYDIVRYLIEWVFPDSENASVPVPSFAYSLWDPADPRWTFFARQQPVSCCGPLIFRDTGSAPPAPVGFPSALQLEDNGLAANASFRSVRVAWQNNDATGTELVQLLAKVAGAWGAVGIFAVAGGDQIAEWDTALPLEAYNVAMRYLNGPTPAVGYESSDPDDWTAPTASESKSTVTTTSEPVTWGTPTFSGGVETLSWTSAQQNAPYLLELSLDSGVTWTTLASDLMATAYAYPVPSGQLNTTVEFRLTAQRDATVGPTAGVLTVYLGLAVGVPTIIAAVGSHVVSSPNTAWTVNALVSWSHAGIAGSTATFGKLRWRDRTGPGPWNESPVVAFAAPAVEDVPAQPDGFAPVGIVSFTTPFDRDNDTIEFQVALGVTDGSSITFGAWVGAPLIFERITVANTIPGATFGTLTATDAPVTVTVPAHVGPLSFPVVVFLDVPSAQAGAWGMAVVLNTVGPNTVTCKLLAAWSGAVLQEQDWWSQTNLTAVPPFFESNDTPAVRNTVGTIP